MAQLIVAAAGAALGGYAISGGILTAAGALTFGAQLGWMGGAMLGSTFSPTQKSAGPRLDDLKVTTSSYGSTIPYIAGHPRVSGQIVWASEKREIATTEEVGKGGGGSEYTTYTYEVDLLYLLSDNEIGTVSRAWRNGEMAWSNVEGSTTESLEASADTTLWTRMTAYSGSADQLPDPDYEAVVGSANAPAYRGRGTVFIKSLQLGSSGQIPNLTFEISEPVSNDVPAYIKTMSYLGEVCFVDDAEGTFQTGEVGIGYVVGPAYGGTYYGSVTFRTYSYSDGSLLSTETLVPTITTSGSADITFYKSGFFRGLRSCAVAFGTQRFHILGGTLVTGITFTFIDGMPLTYAGGAYWIMPAVYSNSVLRYAGGVVSYITIPHTATAQDFAIREDVDTGRVFLHHGSSIGSVVISELSNTTGAILWSQTLSTRYAPSTHSYDFYVKNNKIFLVYALTPTASTTRAYVYQISGDSIAILNSVAVSYPSAMYRTWMVKSGYGVTASFHVYRVDGLVTSIPTNDTCQNVVSNLCQLSGLSAGQFDVSALSTITRPVRAMAISQVSSVRTVLEMLAAAYHFDCVLSDKLYFRPRASSSVATLTFDEFGVAVDSNSDADPLPLMMANELEIPAQMAITFSNVDGDYQTDTQYSDRLLTGQESTSATVLPLGFTASEGKQIADALLLDKAVSALTTTVSVNVTRADLEPTDVVTLTGDDGFLYRMRVMKKTEASGVITLGCVADDASVFTQTGTTDSTAAAQTTVSATAATEFELLDIPLLRDVDNSPGFYLAVMGGEGWTHCAVFTSLDDLTYTQVTTLADQTAIGACTTTLGNWTGGNVFDETSTVTVNVGAIQQLASVTRAELLISQSLNAALVGSELIQYRTATLVSPGVYTLSGLLRGRRGSEWASTGHAASELFVALGTTGMRYLTLQSGDLGSARYYKVASAGQRLSDVTAQTITPLGVPLECYSPVNARANRDTTDTVLTWTRRTRLSTRLTGALAINAPLGETTESYEVEVWDATYTTLIRTITATSETAAYTSAQQVTDFGSDQTVLYLKIFQMSATVGRGYPLTVSI